MLTLPKIRELLPNSAAYVDKSIEKHIRCNRCNTPVLRTKNHCDMDGQRYSYECMTCDEDLFECEVHSDKNSEPTKTEIARLIIKTAWIREIDEEAAALEQHEVEFEEVEYFGLQEE